MPEQADSDIIVIGGGVAGLAAAHELARRGYRVTLLEAQYRLGGRIHTIRSKSWPSPVELGAEFIHVGNPDLWRWLKVARTRARRLPVRHWLRQPDGFERIEDLDRRLSCVTELIDPKAAGRQSFGAYFRRRRSKIPVEAWKIAESFVEGFEAAPLDRISARSLAGETMDARHQYKIPAGYDRLVAALALAGAREGVQFRYGAVVRKIAWQRGQVLVTTRGAAPQEYAARAVVITLPLGVLQARRGVGAVNFVPPLRRHQALFDQMGVGQVLRLTLKLQRAAWRRVISQVTTHPRRGGLGFVHSRVRGVPVWWSLTDDPVMVGWAGGPAASALLRLSPAERRRRALRSLAEICRVPEAFLAKSVVAWEGFDWSRHPFSRGAYSFAAAGMDDAGEKITAPVRDTLFFAGEAFAKGAEAGTVHGALHSGIQAARSVRHVVRRRRVATSR